MNIPHIKNTFRRRLHMLWIVPYIIISFLPLLLWHGIKEFWWILRDIEDSVKDVWWGRNVW